MPPIWPGVRELKLDPSEQAVPSAAVLVLGAAVRSEGPSPALRARCARAAELHLGGLSKRVLCAGLPAELTSMRQLLAGAGVAGEEIEDVPAATTRASLRAAAAALPHGDHILLVSSPYHLPRALEEARRRGLAAVGCASSMATPPRGTRARARYELRVGRSRLREAVALWAYRLPSVGPIALR